MKRLVTLVIALCLIATSTIAFAMPSNVSYNNTKRFLEILDQNDLNYSYLGIDSDNDERVQLGYDGKIKINFYFNEDNEECNIRVWNVIEMSAENVQAAYQICNELNYNYKWVAFYVDTRDNTVTLSMDVILRDNDTAGDICLEALIRVIRIYEKGYEALQGIAL